jgi:hypothetical protein
MMMSAFSKRTMVSPPVCAARIGDVGEARRVHVRCPRHVAAEFFPRNQQRALFHNVAIAAGVVDVQVGVCQVANRLRTDFADRGQDLAGDLLVLRVHHEDAIWTREDANPPARAIRVILVGIPGRASEHVEIGSVLLGENLNLGVIDLSVCGCGEND